VERARLKATAGKYRRQQLPLRAQAQAYERDRDHDMARSDIVEERKAGFDIALAFFEISIVLTSIAAMVKRPFLFVMAAVGGALGLIFGIRGILGGQ
ncbi:MAG: DUF4337 domain-containing protein, partial [Candidatus Eremiobacteraeota bacterium]|nr:DUF4337 domain-containing protein [Candidatus Eremiobacteraeota bacterium]